MLLRLQPNQALLNSLMISIMIPSLPLLLLRSSCLSTEDSSLRPIVVVLIRCSVRAIIDSVAPIIHSERYFLLDAMYYVLNMLVLFNFLTKYITYRVVNKRSADCDHVGVALLDQSIGLFNCVVMVGHELGPTSRKFDELSKI